METNLTLNRLLEQINSTDPEQRSEAWLRAPEVGAVAVRPLAALMAETAPVVSRLAKELARLEIAGQDSATRAKIAAKQEQLRQPLEIGRAAKRGLWKIVRCAAQPGMEQDRRAVVAELLGLMNETQPVSIRREAVWMLSALAGDEAVEPIASLLDNVELRDEARQALERLPGMKSLAALRAALSTSPTDFQVYIAQSLRARGVEVAVPLSKGLGV